MVFLALLKVHAATLVRHVVGVLPMFGGYPPGREAASHVPSDPLAVSVEPCRARASVPQTSDPKPAMNPSTVRDSGKKMVVLRTLTPPLALIPPSVPPEAAATQAITSAFDG